MITQETLALVALIVFVVGVGAGHWLADFRRARLDAERVMRTRSNYRRAKGKQK